jgi:hypothetical protein
MEAAEAAARRLAARCGQGEGGGPPDPARIARACGVTILRRPDVTGALRTSRRGRHLILLPDISRPERRAYAIAHELGEIFLPSVEGFAPPEHGPQLGPEVHFERAAYQQQVHEAAVWFAIFLLTPTCGELAAFDPHAHELASLKGVFPLASFEVIALRVAQRSEGRVTITDNGRLTRRTGFGAWAAVPGQWHPAERRVHEGVLSSGQTCRLDDQGLRVAGFAVFEPEVRRIILISHFDEAYQP